MNRLYLMFLYVNEKAYSSMGYKGTIDEVYQEAARISKEICKDDPQVEIKTRIQFWD